VVRETNNLWIPLFRISIAVLDPLLNLQQSVLDTSGMLLINQVLGDIRIGEVAAKPSEIPAQKCTANEQHGQQQNWPRRFKSPNFGRHCLQAWVMAVIFHSSSSDQAF
jgi:hypothetical protein